MRTWALGGQTVLRLSFSLWLRTSPLILICSFFKCRKSNCQKWASQWASLVGQMVKNLPSMQETEVQFLGREDSLEKGMTIYSSPCLGNLMDRGAWRATVHGVTKSRTWLSDWAWKLIKIIHEICICKLPKAVGIPHIQPCCMTLG